MTAKKIAKWEPEDFEQEMTTVWSFPKRGDWATHDAKWRGNWSPYIPRNLMLRYSQEGDTVLDQFAGGGTTLVEAKLLNRNIIGIDVNDEALERCREKVKFDYEKAQGKVHVRKGDAMRAVDGFVDLVEIKRPNEMLFWANTKDHNNYVPSSDLIKAITQCLNYLYAIEQEANSVKFIERIGCKVIKPRCTLVFGRSKEWNEEQKQAYRILNAAYNQLSIVTYDHLLLRAQSILK